MRAFCRRKQRSMQGGGGQGAATLTAEDLSELSGLELAGVIPVDRPEEAAGLGTAPLDLLPRRFPSSLPHARHRRDISESQSTHDMGTAYITDANRRPAHGAQHQEPLHERPESGGPLPRLAPSIALAQVALDQRDVDQLPQAAAGQRPPAEGQAAGGGR
jgi:hypothetical protein